MQSRVILFLSVSALGVLIVLGSFALHLTSASASTQPSAADSNAASHARSAGDAARGSSAGADAVWDSDRPDLATSETPTPVLTPEEQVSADSLAMLLRNVHGEFSDGGSSVSNAMIPLLAEMITLINQHDHLQYRIEIVEPDAGLARSRAETLNDVLRLNILEPSRLRIIGRHGRHGAFVDVSTS